MADKSWVGCDVASCGKYICSYFNQDNTSTAGCTFSDITQFQNEVGNNTICTADDDASYLINQILTLYGTASRVGVYVKSFGKAFQILGKQDFNEHFLS